MIKVGWLNGAGIASLTVGDLDEAVVRRLNERAAAHGKSAEAEHRAILEQVLTPYRSGLELWEAMRENAPTDVELDTSGVDQAIRAPDFH